MNKLSLLFNLLRVPVTIPILTWIAGAVAIGFVGLGLNKIIKEKKYQTTVKEQKYDYQKCLTKANNFKEIQKCHDSQRKFANPK